MHSENLLNSLKAAAEPTRLRLLAICADGELTVSEITRITGQSQPRISRHLKVLTAAGLLDRFREKHWVFYRVPPGGKPAQLVRRVLGLLSHDDKSLVLDRDRVHQVIQERRQSLGAADDAVPWLDEDNQLYSAIFDALDGAEIGKLLDIGSGTGRMLRVLGRGASEAVGVDISQHMLFLARTNLYQAGITNCTMRHGDMYQLRFANDSFDTVSIDVVLSQAEEPKHVLLEAARVLKPEGNLLLLDYVQDHSSKSDVSPARITEWCEAVGLTCLRTQVIDIDDQVTLLCLAQHAIPRN